MAATTTEARTGTSTERRLLPLLEAVFQADERWAAELASPERKAEYKAAKATYREAEAEAMARGGTESCRRCGGEGGWVGWPGYTCFQCGGSGTEPWRKVRFQAEPSTRAKREAKWEAEAAAQAQVYEQALAQLPPAVADALRDGDAAMAHALTTEPTREQRFCGDLAYKLRKYGSLSEAQVAAVVRGLERQAAKDAEREAVLAQGPLAPGRQVLEGTVLSDKWTEDRGYGSQHKMRVRLTTGHTVYGSVPRGLEDAVRPTQDEDTGEWVPGASPQLVGTVVRFTAAVELKADDPTFAYYSRPTSPTVVAPAPEAEVQA